MAKTLLNEIKRVNELAGTQLTKEQEISFIKNRLQELEFSHQASFDAYKKNHKMRPDTKVKIAGKETTVADASKGKNVFQKLGAKLFGKEKEVEMPKPLDAKNPLNKSQIFDPKRGSSITIAKALENPERYKHLAADIQSMIDVDPTGEKYKAAQDAEKARDKRRKERDKTKQDTGVDTKWGGKDKETKPTDSKPSKQTSTSKDKDDTELEKQQADKKRAEWEKRDAEQRKRMMDLLGVGDDDDNSLGSIIKRIKRKERDDDDSGFGGFGGGSFGGGGASGDW